MALTLITLQLIVKNVMTFVFRVLEMRLIVQNAFNPLNMKENVYHNVPKTFMLLLVNVWRVRQMFKVVLILYRLR